MNGNKQRGLAISETLQAKIERKRLEKQAKQDALNARHDAEVAQMGNVIFDGVVTVEDDGTKFTIVSITQAGEAQ